MTYSNAVQALRPRDNQLELIIARTVSSRYNSTYLANRELTSSAPNVQATCSVQRSITPLTCLTTTGNYNFMCNTQNDLPDHRPHEKTINDSSEQSVPLLTGMKKFSVQHDPQSALYTPRRASAYVTSSSFEK